ncbi:hypothetical protein [Arcobacter sp. s6]|uniref:hypothetical protein n=1 Tax=Arcobacter sp. s6 TaxID=3230363 RepID=UPI0034A04914
MKKNILDRYDKTIENEIIIKIFTNRFENLYDNFDMSSSFLKKDLSQQLVDYVIESVSEISNEKFIIKFYFKEKIEQENIIHLKKSFESYFNYLEELEKNKMREQVKNSFIFMLIGIFFITLSILLEVNQQLTYRIISEGLMIAGWVSMWEAMATILIKWLPLSKKLKLFKRIVNSKIEFENEK